MILANYEPPPALIYQHPGADSYKGSFATAVELLARATGVSQETLYNINSHSRCRIRSWRQGEVADAMVYGRDRVARGVYIDLASWPPSASRLIAECSDGLGNSLILPEVCSNWTYERTELGYDSGPEWESGAAGLASSELGEAAGISSGSEEDNSGFDFGSGLGFLPGSSPSNGVGNTNNANNNGSSNSSSSSSSSTPTLPPTYISTPPNLMPPEMLPNLPGSPTPANEPSLILSLTLALSLTWLIKRGT